MIVLGIETSTMIEGVAVVEDDRVLAEHRCDAGSTHAERLLPAILYTLGTASLTLQDVQGLAVSIGPGSFTGLRIGLSTAKGICLARAIPMAAVPTLDALAYLLPFCPYQVCPILDARRKQVYTAFYHTGDGVPHRLTDYQAIAPLLLLEEITEPTVFLGDGVMAYRELIETHLGPNAHFAPGHLLMPTGTSVALLGQKMLNDGAQADFRHIEPIYLRKSDAELKLEEKAETSRQ